MSASGYIKGRKRGSKHKNIVGSPSRRRFLVLEILHAFCIRGNHAVKDERFFMYKSLGIAFLFLKGIYIPKLRVESR